MSFNCCCSFSSLCTSASLFGKAPDEQSFAADTLAVRAVFVIVELFEMFVDTKLKEENNFQFALLEF